MMAKRTNIYETRVGDISSSFSGDSGYIQGCAVSPQFVFATSGNPSYIAKYDRDDFAFIGDNPGVIDDPMSDSTAVPGGYTNKLQTAFFHNGTVYGFCRAPEIHEIDPSDITYTGTSHYEIVPESEWVDNPSVFEGITRYGGEAFNQPKWFVNLKGDSNNDNRAVYRLDNEFNHEKTYIVNANNPELEDIYHGGDGITMFDLHGHTIYVESVTARLPEHDAGYPGLAVFVYDSGGDEFDFIGLAELRGSEYNSPDEGFQLVDVDEVFAALRKPNESETLDPSLIEMDWSSIMASATIGDATLGEITIGRLA